MSFRQYLFVYGSLKRGFGNDVFLQDSTFVMTTTTKEKYDMVSFGSFPAVVKSPQKYHIEGELYVVSMEKILEEVDLLESNGTFYKRELVLVDGILNGVWMYFLLPERLYGVDQQGVGIRNNVKFWENEV